MAWLATVPELHLYVSAYSIAELQMGVEENAGTRPRRAAALDLWVDEVVAGCNVLAMDAPIFRAWAKLRHGRSDTLHGDATIAATAAVHRLTVVTLNVPRFEALGAVVFNPFGSGG
ncbi:MAG: PIN domain-containing protein [Rhodospirillales bacterium]